MKKKMLLVGMGCLAVGCGGGSGTNPSPVISVGGGYEIQKTIVADGCGGSTGAFSNPASVRHSPGATTFVLDDHGTRDLPGTLAAGGAFQLAPYRGPAGGVEGVDTYDPGLFRSGGFAVRVTTVVLRSQGTPPLADCSVVTDWLATKQGAANVIP